MTYVYMYLKMRTGTFWHFMSSKVHVQALSVRR